MGHDALGDDARLAWSIFELGSEAILRQLDQVSIGCAGIQPGEGVFQFAARSLALDLTRGAAGEGGLAGQKLAEDRAEGEDVATLVEPKVALRDRVCMTAAMLVLEPIFEADLPPEQYATVLGAMPNRRWSRLESWCSEVTRKSWTPTSRTTSGAFRTPNF